MNGQHRPRRLAHRAFTDVRLDGARVDGHHGYGQVGGEPVAVVVPGRVLARVLQRVADQVRHGRETLHARAGTAKVLAMRHVVPLHVQKAVARPELLPAVPTRRSNGRLTVVHDVEANRLDRVARGPGRARQTPQTWVTRISGHTFGTLWALITRRALHS